MSHVLNKTRMANSAWEAVMNPYFLILNRAALSEEGWGRNLTDEELMSLFYMVLQTVSYFLYLLTFVTWYTRTELLLPRFVQTPLRMMSCVMLTALYCYEGVWIGWYRQRPMSELVLQYLRNGGD